MRKLYPETRSGYGTPANADVHCGFTGWAVSAEPIHYDCKECKAKVTQHLLAVYKKSKRKAGPVEQPRLPIMDDWKNEE